MYCEKPHDITPLSIEEKTLYRVMPLDGEKKVYYCTEECYNNYIELLLIGNNKPGKCDLSDNNMSK
jgi:hypothetical protein